MSRALAVLLLAVTPVHAGDFLSENFGFRKEVLALAAASDRTSPAGRASLGFEALKKFSSETKTWGAFDAQGRLARRDGFGAEDGWKLEYHNLYLDLYDLAGPVGAVNGRAGHFYVPFGLNLQTDTHGTLLQLSNEQDLGFERDWYAGFYGPLTADLDYGAYYLSGSGYELRSAGQSGLGAARLSLGPRLAAEYGLEGGASLLGGERLAPGAATPVATRRAGLDGRLRRPTPAGPVTWTTELSAGRDERDGVFNQVHQLDFLRGSRRWGVSAQYRRFQREHSGADASAIAEATWYFRNDVGNSDLHWVKLNVERKLERRGPGGLATILTVQYYRYW